MVTLSHKAPGLRLEAVTLALFWSDHICGVTVGLEKE